MHDGHFSSDRSKEKRIWRCSDGDKIIYLLSLTIVNNPISMLFNGLLTKDRKGDNVRQQSRHGTGYSCSHILAQSDKIKTRKNDIMIGRDFLFRVFVSKGRGSSQTAVGDNFLGLGFSEPTALMMDGLVNVLIYKILNFLHEDIFL